MVERNLFFDAARQLRLFVQHISPPFATAEYNRLQTAIVALQQKIKQTPVTNPQQLDDLYALVQNSLSQLADQAQRLPNAESQIIPFLHHTNSIDKYIADDLYAVCGHVLTSDNRAIDFLFNLEDYYPEYDRKMVQEYPDVFYLEDDEIPALHPTSHFRFSLAQWTGVAKQHPTDAIIVVCDNNNTKTDEAIFINQMKRTPWYWI